MSHVTKSCLTCEQDFQADLREHNRGNAKYCSKECCYARLRITQRKNREPNQTCANCGVAFFKLDSVVARNSKSGLTFCKRSCKDAGQRVGGIEAIQPSHYGTGFSKYRERILREQNNQCLDCGYDAHTAVLHAHHLDGNRKNGVVENLVLVCPTCHTERHLGLRPNVSGRGIVIPLP